MQIKVIFLCQEIVGELKSGTYTIPDEATIRDLFEVCQKENNIAVNPENFDLLVFLADGKTANWHTKLNGVKKIYVLREIIGG